MPGLSFEATNAVTPPLVAPRHSSASADFYREQDSNPDQAEREAAEDDEGGDEINDRLILPLNSSSKKPASTRIRRNRLQRAQSERINSLEGKLQIF